MLFNVTQVRVRAPDAEAVPEPGLQGGGQGLLHAHVQPVLPRRLLQGTMHI